MGASWKDFWKGLLNFTDRHPFLRNLRKIGKPHIFFPPEMKAALVEVVLSGGAYELGRFYAKMYAANVIGPGVPRATSRGRFTATSSTT